MGQLAYDRKTGQIVEAFSLSDEAWAISCAAPRGTLLMPVSSWPAVPKTSIRGLRFFAHHPGFTGILPKPESYAHTRLKIDVVKVARALGYHAEMEVCGSDPDGAEWRADVLVTSPEGRRTAFEIQLSSQHLCDFRARTERYQRSSIECCWLISEKPVGTRLSKALVHENKNYYQTHGEFQSDAEDLMLLGVQLMNKETYPDEPPHLRFSRGPEMHRLPIPVAIQGIMTGIPQWRRPRWHWGQPS